MTDIAVVVPTYRRPEGLKRMLDGLARQTLPVDRWHLILVDDGSGPETAAEIDALTASVPIRSHVIHAETNQGQASARNTGWRSCSAPMLAFTDDDCIPEPGWLAAGLELMLSDRAVGIAQGRTVRPKNEGAYPYSLQTVIREVTQPSPWFEGCNLFLRREALEEAGGFDESMAKFGEETSMAWTILDAGWARGWADQAVVEHELSERPWLWHLKFHFLEGRIVHIAKQHPQIRTMFWRPWAVSKENAYFALGAAGLILTLRRRPAVLLVLPYLHWLWGPAERRRTLNDVVKVGTFQAVVHASSLAGKLIACVANRTVLL